MYKLVTFTRKKPPLSWQYTTYETTLCAASSYKYLGVHLTNELSWNLHINAAAAQASCSHLRNLAYKTYIRPKVEYASATWSPQQYYLTQKSWSPSEWCCTLYHFVMLTWNQHNSTKNIHLVLIFQLPISPAPSSPFLLLSLVCPHLISRTARLRLITTESFALHQTYLRPHPLPQQLLLPRQHRHYEQAARAYYSYNWPPPF